MPEVVLQRSVLVPLNQESTTLKVMLRWTTRLLVALQKPIRILNAGFRKQKRKKSWLRHTYSASHAMFRALYDQKTEMPSNSGLIKVQVENEGRQEIWSTHELALESCFSLYA